MKSVLCVSGLVILFAFSRAALPQADSERPFSKSDSADIWALLVAGSEGWTNYRHQADVCHAYQVLRAHGVPDDHIVVMMADDIAHNDNNPTPGVIINKPNGSNVYSNVPRDYTGEAVTVANFINILKGNKEAMKGIGSGKVIESGPDSFVFVNMVDHGAPGIFSFPEEFVSAALYGVAMIMHISLQLHAKKLNKVIQAMYHNKQYGKMVFYVEACESGSIFDGLLPRNINVYATTAANPKESSWACYYDQALETYLGDVYSVKWMENVDEDGTGETLRRQYEIVKKETTTSHVKKYGDLAMSWDKLSDFMGSNQVPSSVLSSVLSSKKKKPCEDGVPSGDVPIAILTKRIAAEADDAKKAVIEDQLLKELQLRADVRSTVHKIAAKLTTTDEQLNELLQAKSLPRNFDCIDYSIRVFSKQCFNINKVEYAMRQLYVLVNLCELQGMDLSMMENAITATCKNTY